MFHWDWGAASVINYTPTQAHQNINRHTHTPSLCTTTLLAKWEFWCHPWPFPLLCMRIHSSRKPAVSLGIKFFCVKVSSTHYPTTQSTPPTYYNEYTDYNHYNHQIMKTLKKHNVLVDRRCLRTSSRSTAWRWRTFSWRSEQLPDSKLESGLRMLWLCHACWWWTALAEPHISWGRWLLRSLQARSTSPTSSKLNEGAATPRLRWAWSTREIGRASSLRSLSSFVFHNCLVISCPFSTD